MKRRRNQIEATNNKELIEEVKALVKVTKEHIAKGFRHYGYRSTNLDRELNMHNISNFITVLDAKKRNLCKTLHFASRSSLKKLLELCENQAETELNFQLQWIIHVLVLLKKEVTDKKDEEKKIQLLINNAKIRNLEQVSKLTLEKIHVDKQDNSSFVGVLLQAASAFSVSSLLSLFQLDRSSRNTMMNHPCIQAIVASNIIHAFNEWSKKASEQTTIRQVYLLYHYLLPNDKNHVEEIQRHNQACINELARKSRNNRFQQFKPIHDECIQFMKYMMNVFPNQLDLSFTVRVSPNEIAPLPTIDLSKCKTCNLIEERETKMNYTQELTDELSDRTKAFVALYPGKVVAKTCWVFFEKRYG